MRFPVSLLRRFLFWFAPFFSRFFFSFSSSPLSPFVFRVVFVVPFGFVVFVDLVVLVVGVLAVLVVVLVVTYVRVLLRVLFQGDKDPQSM